MKDDQILRENLAYFLAKNALEEMANGIQPTGKTDKLKAPGNKLAESSGNNEHVKALARKIMDDPSFPMLVETARKMAKKHPNALDEG